MQVFFPNERLTNRILTSVLAVFAVAGLGAMAAEAQVYPNNRKPESAPVVLPNSVVQPNHAQPNPAAKPGLQHSPTHAGPAPAAKPQVNPAPIPPQSHQNNLKPVPTPPQPSKPAVSVVQVPPQPAKPATPPPKPTFWGRVTSWFR